MRWQKIARFAIAVFVLVFAGVVFRALRRDAPSIVRPTSPRQNADTTAELGPLESKRFTDDGKLKVAIKAKSEFTYPDGRHVMKEAELTLPDRDGRTLVITGGEMEVTMPQKGDDPIETAKMTKGVRLQASDGLVVTSDKADFDQRTGVLSVPGPVQFTRGRLSGSGVGATYDKNRDVLWLLDQATMKMAPANNPRADNVRVTFRCDDFACRSHTAQLLHYSISCSSSCCYMKRVLLDAGESCIHQKKIQTPSKPVRGLTSIIT